MNDLLPVAPAQSYRCAAFAALIAVSLSYPLHPQAVPAGAPAVPLAAPVRNVTDTYFGVKVDDPYRYMEDLKNPEVAAWIKAEADYTNQVLAAIPGRAQMAARIKELDDSVPERVDIVTVLPGPLFLYEKRLPDQDVPRLYLRKGLTGAESLLVNPEANAAANAPHMVLSYSAASRDGRYVGYGLSPGGSEDAVLHVLDTTTMQETSELIDRAQFGRPIFLADGKSFLYNRLQKLGPDSAPTDRYLDSKVYLHVIGTNPDTDKPVFGNGVAGLSMEPTDIPFAVTVPGGHFAFGLVVHGVLREITVYAAPEEELAKPDLAWKKIFDVSDGIVNFAVRGDDVYVLSHKGASRFQVLHFSLEDPDHADLAHADVVIPASDNVIQNLNTAQDALYVQELHDGMGRLLRVPYGSNKVEEVKLPFEGSISLDSTDPGVPGAYFGMMGWTRGNRILAYDPAKKAAADTGLMSPGKFGNPADLESVEVKVPSHDGVLVPLSIVYRKGTKLDGSHPLLLYGYGSYGITIDPFFDPQLLAWYEQGGIYAVAHIRGGGEYGEDWHLAGKMLTKPNTWEDFIACGEYLIAHQYTSTSRLSIVGGSAGGITVGRSITERPDLFAVAIDEVPASDTVRMEFSPNGPPNIPEFGTVKEEDGFKALFEMSAYQHVKDGTKYPAVMLTSGINDPRVSTWEPAKLTARLQAASSSGKPILFRVDYDAGHGIGSTKSQSEKLRADVYSFILWQVGAPGFQPAGEDRPAGAQ
jgi:prolyl oligopeptidase